MIEVTVTWDEHQRTIKRYREALELERRRMAIYQQYALSPEAQLKLLCLEAPPVLRDIKAKGDSGHMYVIQCLKDYTCKIGHSKNFANRRKQFNISLPFEWEPVMVFELPMYKEMERHYHRFFSHLAVRGEWFNLTVPEIVGMWRKVPASKRYFGQFVSDKNVAYRADGYDPKHKHISAFVPAA